MGAPLHRFREVLIHAQGLHLLALGDLSISEKQAHPLPCPKPPKETLEKAKQGSGEQG